MTPYHDYEENRLTLVYVTLNTIFSVLNYILGISTKYVNGVPDPNSISNVKIAIAIV